MTATTTDFISRAPTFEDAQGILDLTAAYDLALGKQPDMTLDSVLSDWREPGFDLAQDARVITTAQGQIIGYECILNVAPDGHIRTDGYIHPAYQNLGIGTELLRWAETRARQHMAEFAAGTKIALQAGTYGDEPKSLALFQAEGYGVVRRFWRMEIDMLEPPPVPRWRDGITVRTFVPSQDEYATWKAMNEIFEEEWDGVELPFEEWVATKITREPFDASLWFLAMAGDEIAAMARGTLKPNMGWIRTFGVRRRWRRQGLGLALIQHSFGEFYRRGQRTVGLGVDSQNPTQAPLFYQRAGMHVAEIFDVLEKELR